MTTVPGNVLFHSEYFCLCVQLYANVSCSLVFSSQVDYYRICVLPLLKKFLPDNKLELKVHIIYRTLFSGVWVFCCAFSSPSLSARVTFVGCRSVVEVCGRRGVERCSSHAQWYGE